MLVPGFECVLTPPYKEVPNPFPCPDFPRFFSSSFSAPSLPLRRLRVPGRVLRPAGALAPAGRADPRPQAEAWHFADAEGE